MDLQWEVSSGGAPLSDIAGGEVSVGTTTRRSAEFGMVFCRDLNEHSPHKFNNYLDGGKCTQTGLRIISKYQSGGGVAAGGDADDGYRIQFKSQANFELRTYLKINIDILLYCFMPTLSINLRLYRGLMIGAPATLSTATNTLGMMVVKIRKVVNIEATWPYIKIEVGMAGEQQFFRGEAGGKPTWTKRARLLAVDDAPFDKYANMECWYYREGTEHQSSTAVFGKHKQRFCGIDYEKNNMNDCVGYGESLQRIPAV
jgi:hypothetical protein